MAHSQHSIQVANINTPFSDSQSQFCCFLTRSWKAFQFWLGLAHTAVLGLSPRYTSTTLMLAGKTAAAALQQYSLRGANVDFEWNVPEPAAGKISSEASLMLTALATTD